MPIRNRIECGLIEARNRLAETASRLVRPQPGDADGEEQDVASENDLDACSLLGGKASCCSFCIACDVFCGKKKPPENGRLLSFRIVHDLEGL